MNVDAAPGAAPRAVVVVVVVMGVSGCGKTTVGEALAMRLGSAFLEGDTLHPPANIERMAAGTALTDDDRAGWLEAIAQRLAAAPAEGLVVSCSALKRRYRDVLRRGAPALAFVHLAADAALLGQRVRERAHAYMPASLLASQLQALEPPGADEQALTLDAARPTAQLVEAAAAWLQSNPRVTRLPGAARLSA